MNIKNKIQFLYIFFIEKDIEKKVMAPKKVASKKVSPEKKGKKVSDKTPLLDVNEDSQFSLLSQNSQSSNRNRAKNYSKDECEMLVKICADYTGILNKNSNKDSDVKIKQKTWEKIKEAFDTRCHAEAIYVGFFLMFQTFIFYMT